MRSPAEMGIIEIDITNACVHACSNCTRFCGHHKNPFYMGFDTFKRAVDSLQDWNGIVGIIGGEPTLHPEFERFADYLREHRVRKQEKVSRGPIYDMQYHILSVLDRGKSNVVLLSSLSPSYYKHFETINDTFARQLLNDHANACEHQALLMPRKELGIPDDEWIAKRDACWIQNTWSATITPKGAFFCEVAGSLDILFDGPGGWKVEPGWWRRGPEDFKDQLHWCELCSACLDVPKRLSSENRDDVTPEMLKKLEGIGSPKALHGNCVVRDPHNYEEFKEAAYRKGNEYIAAADFQRISKENMNLYAKDVICISRDELKETLFGPSLPKGWIALASKEKEEYIHSFLERYVLNPGCFYQLDDDVCLFHVSARSIRDAILWPHALRSDISSYYPSDKIVQFSEREPFHILFGGTTLEEENPMHLNADTKLIVYGAGVIGNMVVRFLQRNEVENFFVAVTKREDGETDLYGCHVYEIEELVKYRDNSVVLLAVSEKFQYEMQENLKRLGFRRIRFIEK